MELAAITYAAIGLLILLIAGLFDTKTRRAIIEVVLWSVAFMVVWPVFMWFLACYHWEVLRGE